MKSDLYCALTQFLASLMPKRQPAQPALKLGASPWSERRITMFCVCLSFDYYGLIPFVTLWRNCYKHIEARTKFWFLFMKMYEFRLICHWNSFLRFEINNILAVVQIMAWRQPGDMLGFKLNHIKRGTRNPNHCLWDIYASFESNKLTFQSGRPVCDKNAVFNLVLLISICRSSYNNAFRWLARDLTDDKPILN